MSELPWMTVRQLLGTLPVVSRQIDGPTRLVVERYLFRAHRVEAPPLPVDVLLTQFGGSAVEGGAGTVGDEARTTRVPSQSMLVPSGVSSHWQYSGAMDVGIFYILGDSAPRTRELRRLTRRSGDRAVRAPQALELRQLLAGSVSLVPLSDALISATGYQLVHEAQQLTGEDSDYGMRLADVMIEQVIRNLRLPKNIEIKPAHIHLPRIQSVINYIRSEPGADLSIPTLAKRAAISVPHFFRIFMDSTGTSPHQYILETRLEFARRLLAQSRFPISHIAEQCGFSSASHFTTTFRRHHSVTPAKYRRNILDDEGTGLTN